MEERIQLYKEDVLKIAETFNLKPRGNRVIVTTNIREEDGVILYDDGFDEFQYVVAVSDRVKDIKVGDKICLDLRKMLKVVPSEEDTTQTTTVIDVDVAEFEDNAFAYIDDYSIKSLVIED